MRHLLLLIRSAWTKFQTPRRLRRQILDGLAAGRLMWAVTIPQPYASQIVRAGRAATDLRFRGPTQWTRVAIHAGRHSQHLIAAGDPRPYDPTRFPVGPIIGTALARCGPARCGYWWEFIDARPFRPPRWDAKPRGAGGFWLYPTVLPTDASENVAEPERVSRKSV